MTNTQRNTTVHSLKRGLDILLAVSRADRPISITDLSRQLGLAKGSISRVVGTLVQQKFLTRDPETAKFRLGVKLWELGHRVVAARLGIPDVARPVLEELGALTKETVHITVLTENGEMVFLEKLDSTQALQPNIQLGSPHPAYCTANGKAVLAFLAEAELEKMLRGKRPRYTSSTITLRDELMSHLKSVRRIGYAVNRGEYRADVSGVAAPIFDHTGLVVAALGISIPTTRMSPKLIKNLGGLVVDGARNISLALGWSP